MRTEEVRKRLLIAAVGVTVLLAACGGADGPADPAPETTADDATGGAVEGADDVDGGQAVAPAPLSALVRNPLEGPTDQFQQGDLGGGASLAFTGGAYRMVSPGGPLLSPLQDEAMAQMTDVEVSVTVAAVTTPGLVGVMCGGDDTGAYLFVAGLNAAGEPFYAIGRLDVPEAGVQSLRDSNLSDTPPAADVVDPAAGFTIGGRCEPGDTSDEAFLYLEIDGEEVASVSGPFGSSAGEVGLFAIGQGPEPLTVDLNDFEATGTRD